MGGTTNVEVKKPETIDLNKEVSLTPLPPEQLTPEYLEKVSKFYADEPLGKSEKLPPEQGSAPAEPEKLDYYQGGGGVNEPTPKLPTGQISFADFQKIDIRVGEITAVDSITGADKLLKLTVSFGELGMRTIAAGIRGAYGSLEHAQKALVQGRYAFVVNLAPRKLKGVKSQGMLLATHTVTDQVLLIDCKDHVIGARLG